MALITQVLDPLIDPEFAEQDAQFEKVFGTGSTYGDKVEKDCLQGYKRWSTYSIDWADDKLIIATKDSMMRLFDVERGDEISRWDGEWMSVASDPTNPHICAAVSWNGRFRVLDTRQRSDRNETFQFDVDLKKTHQSMKEFLFLCWAPDAKHIAVNNRLDQVYLLDLRQRSSNTLRVGQSMTMQHEVNQMVFASDSSSLWIGTGSSPGRIHAYPSPSLQRELGHSVVGHQYSTISMAADPSGRHIASGGADCLVCLWDPRHLVCTRTFGFATQAVTTLGFNPSGELLAWGTGGSSSSGGEKNLTIVAANTGFHYQSATPAPVQQLRWHSKRNVLAYTLNVSQLPDERDRDYTNRFRGDRGSGRDNAVVQLLSIPDNL
jgi:THO complex subunit 3